MRRPRYRTVDPNTTVNLSDGPLTAVTSWMRWDAVEHVLLNVVLFGLLLAILAVWSAPVDAVPLPARTRAAADDE